jgi:hypothetical protein
MLKWQIDWPRDGANTCGKRRSSARRLSQHELRGPLPPPSPTNPLPLQAAPGGGTPTFSHYCLYPWNSQRMPHSEVPNDLLRGEFRVAFPSWSVTAEHLQLAKSCRPILQLPLKGRSVSLRRFVVRWVK